MSRTHSLIGSFVLAVSLALCGPLPFAAGQEHAHDEAPAGQPADGHGAAHADEHLGELADQHGDEHTDEQPAEAGGAARPRWAWPAATLLLLGAAAGPVVLRRTGRQWPVAPLAAVLALGAVGVVVATRPAPPAHDPVDPRDDHRDRGDHEPALLEVPGETLAALGLETETVFPAEFATGLEATGQIVPVEARQAHVGSRIAGRLSAVRVQLGDRVQAGEVVATLDSVDAAQAAASWREAEARLAAASRGLATRRELAAGGTFTATPLEDARRNLAGARLTRTQIASEMAQARNEAESARAELTRTVRLADSGSYTTAAVEDARQKLAEAERVLAEARGAVAAAEADATEADGSVAIARSRLAGAEALATRTTRLAATGELDRAPLEQARNTLAAAKARLLQAEAGLTRARQQATRGEQLYEAELIALNDLEQRRTAQREREAERDEAATAVEHAAAALARAEQISGARMASGRAEQEADNAVAEARRELSAAEARQAKATARSQVVAQAVAPAETAVATARATLQREQALAADKTRAHSVVEAAELRVTQAERVAAGKAAELSEAQRQVDVAAGALAREERLAASQVREREQLLDAEREVRAARIARDNAAEILKLLGSSPAAAARGPVTIPVRSPLAGVVTALDATVGEAVDASQNLLTVMDLSEVYLEADVYERDLAAVRPGHLVRAQVRAYPGEIFVGTVVSLSGELDPETRAAHVRARLENPAWRLRPNMFATAAFETSRTAETLTVPAVAVQEVEGHTVVFVQQAPEQYELREVTTGRRVGERVEIAGGLQPGDVVVTQGSYLLKSQQLKSELGHGHAH